MQLREVSGSFSTVRFQSVVLKKWFRCAVDGRGTRCVKQIHILLENAICLSERAVERVVGHRVFCEDG